MGEEKTPPLSSYFNLAPEKVFFPATLFFACVFAAMTGTWWVGGKLNEINMNLLVIQHQLNQSVSESRFADWREELREKNPTINVPVYRMTK